LGNNTELKAAFAKTAAAWLLLLPFLAVSQTNLFRISGKKMNSGSFVFGTMHANDPRLFHFNDSTLPALRSCRYFGMELNVNEVDFMKVADRIMLKKGVLSDLYNESEYELIRRYFADSLHIPILLIQGMKPLYVSTMIETDVASVRDGEPAMDFFLQTVADSAGLETIGLEQLEEQLDAIDHISIEEQSEMLLETVKQAIEGGTGSFMENMISYYVRGELDSLLILSEISIATPEFERELLTIRNRRMSRRMIAIMKKGPVFVAVGALHLPGPGGLLDLLRKKGFEVNPLR